jgi:hypothetical protein
MTWLDQLGIFETILDTEGLLATALLKLAVGLNVEQRSLAEVRR